MIAENDRLEMEFQSEGTPPGQNSGIRETVAEGLVETFPYSYCVENVFSDLTTQFQAAKKAGEELKQPFRYLVNYKDAFDVRHNMDTNAKLIMREKQALYREKIKLERLRLEKQRKKEERGEKEKIAVKKITGEQADELAAWKDLLHQGIIDEMQYEEKRKIILGLD